MMKHLKSSTLIGLIIIVLSVVWCSPPYVVAALHVRAPPQPGTGLQQLEIVIHYPTQSSPSKNFSMYIRGGPGVVLDDLTWDKGLPVANIGQSNYRIVLNYENNQSGRVLSVKPLLNDRMWSIGSNFDIILSSTSNSVHLFPWFYSYEGTIEKITNVYSPQLSNSRDLSIYLPPSFYENPLKRYRNVLVMHDGQNLFDPNTAFMHNAWMCQDTANGLTVEGQMEEIIIIAVDNTPDRINELTYSYDRQEGFGGKGDLYLDFIENTVIPLVVSKYSPRIVIDERRLGILGSSLGGLISCYAGWTRSNMYGRIGCMSSSFWWNQQDFNRTILPRQPIPAPDRIVYLDSGNQGPDNDGLIETQTVRDHIARLPGFKLDENLIYYLDDGAEHSEYYWGKRFHIPMRTLYPSKPVNYA